MHDLTRAARPPRADALAAFSFGSWGPAPLAWPQALRSGVSRTERRRSDYWSRQSPSVTLRYNSKDLDAQSVQRSDRRARARVRWGDGDDAVRERRLHQQELRRVERDAAG